MNTIVSRLRAATVLSLVSCALCIPASAAWTYNASAKTLTESVTEGTAWVLNLTVSGNEATVKSVKTVGATTDLDLASAAESDCPPIVALADSAFNGRSTLTSITLPETLRSIGQLSFYKCTALTNVAPFLPASVTSIGIRAFYNTGIKTPLVLSNPGLTSLPGSGEGLFALSTIPSADLSRSGLVSIGKAAFYKCAQLGSVSFPNTLQSIDEYGFFECTSLTNVAPFLPASVSYLGPRVFTSSPIKVPLVLSNSRITSIPGGGYGVFQSTRIPSADLSRSGLTSIGETTFYQTTALTNVVLPKTLASVGKNAFNKTSGLKNVEFKGSYPTFGSSAFGSSMTLPARVTFPLGDATWESLALTKLWAGATDAQRNAYLAAGFPAGRKPIGYLDIGGTSKWLVPVNYVVGTQVIMY